METEIKTKAKSSLRLLFLSQRTEELWDHVGLQSPNPEMEGPLKFTLRTGERDSPFLKPE